MTERQSAKSKDRAQGFTLIELAIVLVILGLLIGIGVSLLGPLTKQAKYTKSVEIVKSAREAVVGFVLSNRTLPSAAQFQTLTRTFDAWSGALVYAPFGALVGADVCCAAAAGFTVNDLDGVDRNGIAFLVFSAGEDHTDSTTAGAPPPDYNVLPYSSTYDDIVEYVSINELRNQLACSAALQIIPKPFSNAVEDRPYSEQLEAQGGCPPYTWAPAGPIGDGLTLDGATGLISGTMNYCCPGGGCTTLCPSNTGELSNCTETTGLNVTVTDTAGAADGPTAFTVPVSPQPLTVITQTLPDAYEGSAYNATIDASGGTTPYAWNMIVVPPCPAPLACGGNTITGTPPPGSAGSYTVTSTVTDTCPTNQTRVFLLTINP